MNSLKSYSGHLTVHTRGLEHYRGILILKRGRERVPASSKSVLSGAYARWKAPAGYRWTSAVLNPL